MTRLVPSLWENVADADWLYLNEGEAVRWTGRPSRYTIAIAIGAGLILALIGLVLYWWLRGTTGAGGIPAWTAYLPLALLAIGVGWAGLAYLNWLRVLYVITDEEVYVKHGLVSRDVTQIRLDRVQNTEFEQSVLERVLQYGDVRIYTAGTGTDDLVLRSVPKPQRISQLLTELLSDTADPLAASA